MNYLRTLWCLAFHGRHIKPVLMPGRYVLCTCTVPGCINNPRR